MANDDARPTRTSPSLEDSIAGIGGFTGDDWERLTIGRQRIISLDAITTMRITPQGRRIAWDATKSLARLLLTIADPEYQEEFATILQEYEDLIAGGQEPDAAIEKLFDLANKEAADQGRLGKRSPPLSKHTPILTRNKT